MPGLVELYAAHPFWFWAGFAALLLAVEVASGSGWLLWPSASAVAVGALTVVASLTLPWALLAFAAVTIASTLLARRYLPRSVSGTGADINDNVGRLVGHHGHAAIAFEDGRGRADIDGKEWAAELEAGGALPAGERLLVTGVSGAVLKVRPAR